MEEDWDQIGKRLRNAREAADLVLDDVMHQTRIPRNILEALEAENFSIFTSPTYAKSFLRQYSEFLNVDAKPWLDALEPASYVRGEVLQPIFESASDDEPVAPQRRERRERNTADSGSFSAVWLMVLSAVLVVGAVVAYQFLERKFEEPVQSESQVSEEKAQPVVTKARENSVDQPVSSDPKPAQTPPSESAETSTRVPRAIIVRD